MTFTPSQYQQLLQLLGKENKEVQTADGSNGQEIHANKSVHVAGKFCFISSSGSSWIVDNGATDHICHDLSVFSQYTEI